MALQQARRRLTAGLLQGWGARSAAACGSGAEATLADTTLLGFSRALCSAAATDSSRSLRSAEWWGKMSMGFSAACAMGLTASWAFSTVAAEEATEVVVVEQAQAPEATTPPPPATRKTVVFVLGGPGSGKGTQCAKLIEDYEIAHFSAGDLLRAHVNSGSAEGNMVAEMIKEGKIVPAEVTVGLLKKAVEESGVDVVLIDGFPRSIDNRECFERVFGYDAHLVLFFDCPEEVLEKRLLGRNQGRVDDNIETIKKRFKVFVDQSLPVIEYYEKLGKVKRIDTNRPVQDIYEEVLSIFAP